MQKWFRTVRTRIFLLLTILLLEHGAWGFRIGGGCDVRSLTGSMQQTRVRVCCIWPRSSLSVHLALSAHADGPPPAFPVLLSRRVALSSVLSGAVSVAVLQAEAVTAEDSADPRQDVTPAGAPASYHHIFPKRTMLSLAHYIRNKHIVQDRPGCGQALQWSHLIWLRIQVSKKLEAKQEDVSAYLGGSPSMELALCVCLQDPQPSL